MSATEESDFLRNFGLRVRQLRKDKGLSQEEFASICELDRTYIGGIERGERNPSLKNILKIADALHSTVPELFYKFPTIGKGRRDE
ncbi:transcriptional regulator [Parasaccharibacter sp. TMW2.1882]|uniref:helix-turn-helix domain-containing protein n=1 Tax=Parasaccharibacter sp. TMW2.1882 TaxID=2039286 RepID=UPI0020134862|nr:helix-turn-helix transcriptional regulator [Parasaccharibacter sp. TMW2.1882]MCL1496337.1 transcriptional regulator [Parasaccharibacter sp. TMW2.1882]MCL1563129.1 XRE family transcriptional regulator [Parasaccharibacter sp. TMW 2.1886]